jgi:hypothetical protein
VVSFESKIKLLGQHPVARLPELDEAQDFIVLLILAQIRIGIAEHLLPGILGKEGEDALLPAAALGDVVFLEQRILAVKRDGMEVQVKGLTALDTHGAQGIEPVLHEYGIAARFDATAVFGEEGSLWDGIEACKQRQALIEDARHDVLMAGTAEELQGEQGAYRMNGRDLQGAGQRHAGHHRLEAHRDQERNKQEQAPEFGAKVPRIETEGARIGHGGRLYTRIHRPLLIGAARQFGEAVGLEDLPDRWRAQALMLLLKRALDIVDRAVLLAKRDHLLMQCRGLFVRRCRRAQRMPIRQEERHLGVLTELMTQQAKAPRGVVEPGGDLFAGDFIDVEGAQSLVLAVQGVDGAQEGVNEGIVGISQWSLLINANQIRQHYGIFKSKCNNYLKISTNIEISPGAMQVIKVEVSLSINRSSNRRGGDVPLDCDQTWRISRFFRVSASMVLTEEQQTWASRLV